MMVRCTPRKLYTMVRPDFTLLPLLLTACLHASPLAAAEDEEFAPKPLHKSPLPPAGLCSVNP